MVKAFQVKRGEHKGHVVGISGDLGAGLIFLRWYEDSLNEKPLRDDSEYSGSDFEALIMRPDGVFTIDDHCELIRIADDFVAIGSGAAPAMAAMHAGTTAIRAVEIAALCDIRTGGPVVAYSLKNRVK